MEQWKEVHCNKRITREVSEELEQTISLTEEIIDHYSSFIASTISSGNLEGVFVPYLGKFQIKPKSEQYRSFIHSLGAPMKSLFLKIGDSVELLNTEENSTAEDSLDDFEEDPESQNETP